MSDVLILARDATAVELVIAVLFTAGILAFIGGRLWLIAVIARSSFLAALLCFVVPFLEFGFVKDHWTEAKPGAIAVAAGIAGMILAGLLALLPGPSW